MKALKCHSAGRQVGNGFADVGNWHCLSLNVGCNLQETVVQHADPWRAKAAQVSPRMVPAPSLLESWESHMQRGKLSHSQKKKCERQEQAFGSPLASCSQLAVELSPCSTDPTVWSSLYFGQF